MVQGGRIRPLANNRHQQTPEGARTRPPCLLRRDVRREPEWQEDLDRMNRIRKGRTAMAQPDISIQPLNPVIGAVVAGVDLSEPTSPETFKTLHSAWLEHVVLFFRDQDRTAQLHGGRRRDNPLPDWDREREGERERERDTSSPIGSERI